MAEYFALGVDLALTAGMYGWYRSSRHNADLVKNASSYEIGSELENALKKCPDQSLSYACVEGVARPVSDRLLHSKYGSQQGLIQLMQYKEHKSKRSQGFWSDVVRIIKDVRETVPFALFRSQSSPLSETHVHVQQPLEASFLEDDLTTTYDNFEPTKLGLMERGMERLFGDVNKGFQETEEMLQVGTGLLGIGKLVYSNSKIKLEPPEAHKGPYILTSRSKAQIVRDLESKSSALRMVTFVFGVTGVLILCYIMRKLYRRWQENEQYNRPLREARLRRERHQQRSAGDSDNDDGDNSNSCVICLMNPREVVLLNCGHICMCADCVEALPQQRCPICRADIVRIVNTYQS